MTLLAVLVCNIKRHRHLTTPFWVYVQGVVQHALRIDVGGLEGTMQSQQDTVRDQAPGCAWYQQAPDLFASGAPPGGSSTGGIQGCRCDGSTQHIARRNQTQPRLPRAKCSSQDQNCEGKHLNLFCRFFQLNFSHKSGQLVFALSAS